MAVRPLVTTGVALLSAGAVIAGTPALFVPRDEVTITASTIDSPAHRTLTQEQINLLAFSLEGLWHAYTQGYGGIYTGTLDGDCSADGAVCRNGLSGAAYYFSDNVLPLGNLDNIAFEGGLSEFLFLGATAVASAIPDPTGRLDLPKRVDEYFHGFSGTNYLGDTSVAVGLSSVVYSIINDNVPDGGFLQAVNDAYFSGYGSQSGISAVVTYVVDAITQDTVHPQPTLGVGPQTATADEPSALLKAEPEPGSATSTSLPNVGKLLNLPTPKFKAPEFKAPEFKAPVSPLGANLDVQGKVQEEVTVDETVEGGTEGTPVVNEPTKPEAPKLTLPKLNLKLPNTKLKEAAAEEESEDPAGSGVTSGAPNKFEPQILFGNKGKSTGGHNFLKDIDNAVKKFTGGGDEKSTDGAGSDSNGDSSK
ncbi:hypothetical protein [Mycobacterium sp. URHD0025]|uniref:hypothetical protein n=1 Tax=Mycobacterium sp. URHD0025 TaxID=1298864 RepID=UPI0004118E5C|nr:hypothetical protein [Mycobacterium sp. URHD0025]